MIVCNLRVLEQKSELADTRARDLIIVRSGRRSFGRSLTLGAARSRVGHWWIKVISVAIIPCDDLHPKSWTQTEGK